MITLKKTDATNTDFISLVKLLDTELAIRDGEDHDFYHQYNGINDIKYAVIFYSEGQAVSCGAIKKYSETSVEIKRMFTLPSFRGKGFASKTLVQLENWAKELGFTSCLLETGIVLPEAINLYVKNGYELIENFDQYKGVETSRCFEKKFDLHL